MDLDTYRRKKGWTYSDMARKLDISQPLIWNYCHGKSPSRKMAAKIVMKTQGRVGLKDLIKLLWPEDA